MLDDQRALVVRERYRLRILERGVQILQLQRLAAIEQAGEHQIHVAAPLGPRALLLVLRDAFGEPPRHALVRHLQRDHVPELVPQRRFPLEIARRARLRRVHRDDAAEADAEGADHAGQAERAHGEVVVAREDLDENRTARRELVARRHRVERLVREGDRVLLQHRRLVLVHAQDQIAVAHGDELIEAIHHLQEVVGERVVRVGLERRLERRARARLVARAQQLDAEIGERAVVLRVERERAPRELHRFVEAIVVRGELAGRQVHVGVIGRDRERLGRPRLELLRLVLDEGERGAERVRVEARRIDGEGLVDRLARLVVVARVGRFAGEKELRVDRRGVHFERALGETDGLRGVLLFERPRGAHQRRRPPRVGLQRHLERLERVGPVEFLEEQLAPSRLNRWIAREAGGGLAIRRVGFLEAPQCAERARAARHLQRIVARVGEHRDFLEDRRRVGAPEHLLEQPELQRRIALPGPGGGRPKHRFGGVVAAAGDRGPRLQRDARRIARIELVGGRFHVVVVPFVEGADGGLQRRRRAARRLSRAVRRQHEERKRGSEERKRSPAHSGLYYRLQARCRP